MLRLDAELNKDIIIELKRRKRRANIKLVQKAYEFANKNHEGQLRKSGEPYIIHPLNVAYILATAELDEPTICAALLHDIVEDTKVTHQDIGQMQMYVNYYDRKEKKDEENPSIGILLCTDKNETVVKYTLPENNESIFASEYKLHLPTEEEWEFIAETLEAYEASDVEDEEESEE